MIGSKEEREEGRQNLMGSDTRHTALTRCRLLSDVVMAIFGSDSLRERERERERLTSIFRGDTHTKERLANYSLCG